jgi:RNA polymerase sigma-70 factor, ECF subfamily
MVQMLELEGFDAFCAAHWRHVVQSVTLFTGDSAAAEELAQEAFLKAALRWGRICNLDKPDAWVRHVAMNAAKSVNRRKGTAERVRHLLNQNDSPDFADGHADAEAVQSALLRLEDRDRRILILRYFVGASTAEIAAQLGISEGAARTCLSRATTRLRPLLCDAEGIGDRR